MYLETFCGVYNLLKCLSWDFLVFIIVEFSTITMLWTISEVERSKGRDLTKCFSWNSFIKKKCLRIQKGASEKWTKRIRFDHNVLEYLDYKEVRYILGYSKIQVSFNDFTVTVFQHMHFMQQLSNNVGELTPN